MKLINYYKTVNLCGIFVFVLGIINYFHNPLKPDYTTFLGIFELITGGILIWNGRP